MNAIHTVKTRALRSPALTVAWILLIAAVCAAVALAAAHAAGSASIPADAILI